MSNNVRVPHYLKPNRKSRSPSNLMFLDTETYPNKITDTCTEHQLRCWCSIAFRLEGDKETRRAEQTGTTQASFWTFLVSRLEKRRPLWLFAHNAAFDMITIGLGHELEQRRFCTEIATDELGYIESGQKITNWQGLLVLDGPPTIIELVHFPGGEKLIIVDTLNYWRCSLGDLGHAIGIKKGVRPAGIGTGNDWLSYCRTDTTIIANAISAYIRFVREADIGNFRYTAVSQGLQSYRHRFMQHKLLVHCNEDALKLERDGYFGGDCTIHRIGKVQGPIFVLDAQSFYPSICRNEVIPYCLVKHIKGDIEPGSVIFARQYYLIARCKLRTETIPFPVRYRGLLIRALGEFETVLHQPELLIALQNNCVQSISEIALYQSGRIFRKFVDEMWTRRQEALQKGDKVNANFFKLILNSPFGKLGQKQQEWTDCPEVMSFDGFGTWLRYCPETKHKEEYRCFGYRVQRRRRLGEPCGNGQPVRDLISVATPTYNDESTNSIPQIPGAITSYGRVILARYIEIAGKNNVYYTDTDCLHVNAEGFRKIEASNLIRDGELGFLSIRNIAQEAEYRGIKYYRLDNEWVIAGVKKDKKEVRDGVYRQYDFTGWNTLMCGAKNAHIQQLEIEIDRTNEYIPGRVDSVGIVYSPIIIKDVKQNARNDDMS